MNKRPLSHLLNIAGCPAGQFSASTARRTVLTQLYTTQFYNIKADRVKPDGYDMQGGNGGTKKIR